MSWLGKWKKKPKAEMNQVNKDDKDMQARSQTAEVFLQNSANMHKIISEQSPDAIFISDREGNYVYANQAACELLGYSKEEFLKMNIVDISAPGKAKADMQLFGRLLKSKSLFIQTELCRKDSSVIPVDLNAVALPNGLVYGSCRDITERKQAEESLRKSESELRLITENTRDLISITALDMNATFIYASPSYEKVLGYSPDELIGSSGMDFIHPEDKKRLLPLLKKYVTAKTKQLVTGKREEIAETIECRLPQKSGGWRYVEAVATLSGKEMVFVSRDITERKQAEERIKKNLKDLEHFKEAAIGREHKIIELKKEVNELSQEFGKEAPYDLSFLE